MNLTLSINETIWQYELDKYNATESAKVAQGNEAALKQHTALMNHTPEKLRTNFTPGPDFIPLTNEQYVAKFIAEKEAAISTSRTTDHLAIIAKQDSETIQRFAKVTALPDHIKEMLATQVDAQ